MSYSIGIGLTEFGISAGKHAYSVASPRVQLRQYQSGAHQKMATKIAEMFADANGPCTEMMASKLIWPSL
jgi:hypothetical protein